MTCGYTCPFSLFSTPKAYSIITTHPVGFGAMRLIRDLIVLALLILIKIGDAVLFVLSLIPKNLQQISSFLSSKFKRPKTVEIFNAKALTPAPFSIRRLLLYISFPKRTKPIEKMEIRKKKRIKRIVVYHFPILGKLKFFFAGTLFSFIFVFAPLLFYVFFQDLPSPTELTLRQIPQTTKIYDRNGTLLYQIYATYNRTIVPLSEIPTHLQLATIAIEDKDFYKHPGFDISAIVRSAYANLSGGQRQGGSTITQQLIKSALLTPQTSIVRKLKELILAFWAERLYTKSQILELYFNQVPYGGTAWGVEAASQIYFGKHVKDLTLGESTFLAGIPRAPTIYSPFGTNPHLWKKRQKEVLNRMVALNFISQAQAQEAQIEELQFETPQTPLYAPYFVMYARDSLVKKYGLPIVERGGLTVITSLDLKTNSNAEKIVREEVANNASLNLTNGAALVTNPSNGDILAMVGGKDFSDPNGGNVNVTTRLRQPGSSIKIITYSAALQNGLTAATILDDSPVTYRNPGSPAYSPVNYDGKFHGKVPLRLAFANSFNIPAVRTLNHIGISTFVNLGKKMGINSWNNESQYGLSITLGGAEVKMTEMATVYGVLANNGERVDLNPFLKVTDSKGNVLEEKKEIPKQPVLDTGIAFILSDILADNNARSWAFGPNSILKIPRHVVSVKTGTSDNKRDNWTIGYTPQRLVAVWVGNNDNSPMSQTLTSGITGAAPIWNKIMTNLLADIQTQKPPVPENVIQKQCLGRQEYFIKGTENSVNCTPLPPSPSPKP